MKGSLVVGTVGGWYSRWLVGGRLTIYQPLFYGAVCSILTLNLIDTATFMYIPFLIMMSFVEKEVVSLHDLS